MSDTDDNKPDPKPTDPTPDPDKGDGKAAQAEAEKWKALARKHEAQAKANADKAKKFDELDEASKSEAEKAAAKAADAEKRAADAEARALRMEVAYEKGLTPAQAKRLVGASREELESDADEFLESIKPDNQGTPPGGKPKEDLRGGGDPSSTPEEMDPRKLAEMVPRS